MKPLLKWAGGKRWLVPLLSKAWLHNPSQEIIEPFAGGMALTLGLGPKLAKINDANVHLINFYRQVQKGLKNTLPCLNDETYYYQMRAEFNSLIRQKKTKSKKAACLFYYLMKTGFNGLCRFNNSGEFNVPFGQYKQINYSLDFYAAKDFFAKIQFSSGDFAKMKFSSQALVYADPPYDVPFRQYCSKGFAWTEQVRLANWLCLHPGPVITSNQATARIIKLYQELDFTILKLPVRRRIACNGNRIPAIEILAFKQLTKGMVKSIKASINNFNK